MKTMNIFIAIWGSYYHLMTEAALGLYELLERESLLESRDCKIYFQGGISSVVQYFSVRPVIQIPFFKPRLESIKLSNAEIMNLQLKMLSTPECFKRMLNLSNYLIKRTPHCETEKGITVINRLTKRCYRETAILLEKLKIFGVPVRVVSFENMSLAEQISAARNTLLLIAPHGAGTVNMMFMPKGGGVIELFPKGYENWHAGAMANAFGHKLVEIESQQPGEIGRLPSDDIRKHIEKYGWPTRLTVRQLRKRKLPGFNRFVRDVKSYSIDPDLIVEVSRDLLRGIHCE